MANNMFQIKSTIVGFVLFFLSGGYYLYPLFGEEITYTPNTYISLGGFVLGLIFLFAPDSLVKMLGEIPKLLLDFIKKKFGKNGKQSG